MRKYVVIFVKVTLFIAFIVCAYGIFFNHIKEKDQKESVARYMNGSCIEDGYKYKR